MFKILHVSARVARTASEHLPRVAGRCVPAFEHIGSVSTVESNYFFAKPNYALKKVNASA